MAACENIDVTPDQKDTLLFNISGFIYSNTSPYTIVDYVCATLDIPDETIPVPEISATNWCLLTCISSCVFKNSTFIAPSSYIYINKPRTYTCVVNCFPVFVEEPPSGGGGGAPAGGAAAENLAGWSDKQCENIFKKLLEMALRWLYNFLKRLLFDQGITVASFAMWILMLVEHLAEITWANIKKKIGAAIEWASENLKKAKDLVMGYIDQARAFVTGTEPAAGPAPHLHTTLQQVGKNIWGALTKIVGYITDNLGNIGEHIERLGQFLHDAADKLWDIKEIAFALMALASMIAEIVFIIRTIFQRISAVLNNALLACLGVSSKYTQQIAKQVDKTTNMTSFNNKVDAVVNNKYTGNLEAFLNKAKGVTTLFGDSKLGPLIS